MSDSTNPEKYYEREQTANDHALDSTLRESDAVYKLNTTSSKPVRKVAAAGIGGAAVVVIVWGAGLFGLDIPVDVAVAIVALVSFGAGYLTPSKTGEHVA